MNTFLAIVKLIPALISLITEIEKVVPVNGQGSAKITAIKGIMEATYDGVNEMWPALEKVIATLVNLFNVTGQFAKKA